MNFIELNKNEVLCTQGGAGIGPEFFTAILKKSILGAIIIYVADNWSDIKNAVVDGINDGTQP